MSKPICWIIAGPNGAGKTTFALKYLPDVAGCKNFVNADLIAAGLSPFAPEKELLAASRLFLKEIQRFIKQRESFGFETTLSGRSYFKLIRDLLVKGWQVELIYLALPDAEMSVRRVEERMEHGGHSVDEEVIRRRFPRSLDNLLNHFSMLASRTRCFLNSNDVPELIFEQVSENRDIIQHEVFRSLLSKVCR